MDFIQEVLERRLLNLCDPRRRQEKRDARMIQEDHQRMANCPEEVVYHIFDPWKRVERLKQY